MSISSVLIVEDDPAVRAYLATTLAESDRVEVVGAVDTLAAARAACEGQIPDVVLVDLGLPDGSGIDLIRDLRERRPATQCLVITGFNDESHVFAALESGARGYLYKDEPDQEILRAVHQLLDGGAPISPIIARLLLSRFERPISAEPREQLTEREITVLNLVSRGFTAREIASQLEIAYYTVTTHVKNIYRKLEVNSRAEALFEAGQLGLLSGPQQGDR